MKIPCKCQTFPFKEAFDESTFDKELWDELDQMDEGDRINVPITVMDLKRIRQVLKGKYCDDPRHAEPCPLPCAACEDECAAQDEQN